MKCVAYCRVSTEEGDQLNSLQNQIEYYTELFQEAGYQPASTGIYHRRNGTYKILTNGIYADQGITGTKTLKRKAFKAMMKDAAKKVLTWYTVKTSSVLLGMWRRGLLH